MKLLTIITLSLVAAIILTCITFYAVRAIARAEVTKIETIKKEIDQ
jgi:hypothetical protein